jgi:cytochrome c-type biogenesis protein CcmF
MIGNIGIIVAFLAALITAILYLREACAVSAKQLTKNKWALYFYHIHTAGLLITSIYLFYALISHKFEYYYVYAHTSIDLPFKYLISAFWAGQEGTFILWALITAIAGYLLIKREKELLPVIVPVVMLGQLFLLFFLFLENPFYHLGMVPPDGMGLNPLLMDPWMVIHPPVVFVGYALLIFPFAYAVASLWKKDFQKGLLRALPWAAAGWFFLGTGILIGGAWAYRVLGWGGYWGWDPVENASLVPWLTCTALVHGLIAQKQNKLYVKSNLLLAIITYALIIFATYLTRSGVMAEFSVHAFAETTLSYFILSFFLIFFLGGLLVLIGRYKELPRDKENATLFSRQGSFTITLIVLSLSGALVMLGTLSPLLTGIFGSPASVDENFYLQTNAPLVFVIFLVLTLCPLLTWKNEQPQQVFKQLQFLFYIMVPALAAGYFLGIQTFLGLLMVAALVSALVVNFMTLRKIIRKGLLYSGGYIAHIGLAILFAGVLGSTGYTQSQMLILPRGENVEAFGYQFNYKGIVTEGDNNYPEIIVSSGEKTFTARPNLYLAGGRLMRSPAIHRNITRDLYISPLEVQSDVKREDLTLAAGQGVEYNDYKIIFNGFQFEPHSQTGVIEVGALIEIHQNNQITEYMPLMRYDEAGKHSIPVETAGLGTITLEDIDADNGLVRLTIESVSDGSGESFIIEVKIKPLISMLMVGSFLLAAGTAIAVWRRFKN